MQGRCKPRAIKLVWMAKVQPVLANSFAKIVQIERKTKFYLSFSDIQPIFDLKKSQSYYFFIEHRGGSRFPQVNCAIHYPLSTCLEWILRELILHGADTISPRRWYIISTEQIPYPHGARNISARRKKFSCTASQCRFHGRNRLFLWGKYHVYVLKVCCFFTAEGIFLVTIH